MGVGAEVDEVKDRAQEALEGAARSTWLERMARGGLVARGLLYLVVAVLAGEVALGRQGARADKQGALLAVVQQPFGRLLVLALAVGFAGYAVWRFVEAAVGPPGEPGSHKATVKRVGYAARGLLYAFFAASAVKLFIWSTKAGSSTQVEEDWATRVLAWPGGAVLVQLAGAAAVGAGLYVGWRGLSGTFQKRLKSIEMGRAGRRWVRVVGTVGMVARMLVMALIGSLLIGAARHHDPAQAVGIDGALKRLADRAYGPALLIVVACGLAAYGLYSFAEARYRRVAGH